MAHIVHKNYSWGYARIACTLADRGYTIGDLTMGNSLTRHRFPPTPEKPMITWKEFISAHLGVLIATDFFTAEVWTPGGRAMHDVLFRIYGGRRKVDGSGVTPYSNSPWMVQRVRNLAVEEPTAYSPFGRMRASSSRCQIRPRRYGHWESALQKLGRVRQ